jgi:hypothetical protein
MRKFLGALVGAVAIAATPAPVHALNTFGTDMSDLWYDAAESGWGVNLAHQDDIIFMTLFVYGADGRARWYVADALQYSDFLSEQFSGPLYETSGPYFAGTFNPALVNARQVGTATVRFGITTSTLTYSVDGVQVSKDIQRQTFRANNLAGTYIGAAVATATGCGASSGTFENSASFTISHTGSAIAIAASMSNGQTCTYAGTYQQAGRMGSISGQLSCSNGASGTFEAFELEAGYSGFLTRYNADYGAGCTESGRIGGLKR